MSVTAPRIAMQLVDPMIEWLNGRGVDAEPLLSAAGIPVRSAANAPSMVPLSSYVKLLESSAAAISHPHLGLKLGQFEEPGTLGALGYLFMSAASLLDAFEGFCGHLDALQEDTTNRLLISGDSVIVQYRINDESISHRRQDAEYSISAMHTLTLLYSDAAIRPREVCFEHRQVGKYSTYLDLFHCDVFFEQPCNTLVYRREGFNVRNRRRSNLLNPIIASHLSHLAEHHASTRSYTARVIELIEMRISDSSCNQARIAEALEISVPTLVRRLRSEGSSFRDLLRERRLMHAERLLKLDDTPVAEIALAVGYAENASFTRAFRRQYSVSPEQYRRARRRAAAEPQRSA
jgi:AraC-like DNA-binding protein